VVRADLEATSMFSILAPGVGAGFQRRNRGQENLGIRIAKKRSISGGVAFRRVRFRRESVAEEGRAHKGEASCTGLIAVLIGYKYNIYHNFNDPQEQALIGGRGKFVETNLVGFCSASDSIGRRKLSAGGCLGRLKRAENISRGTKEEASITVGCMKLQEPIRTERLILRPFTLTDAPRVKALAGDQRIYETTLCIPHPYEEGMAESWISTHQRYFYEGLGVVFAICLSDGLLIGAASLARTGLCNRAELGYWIGIGYWNNGYCTEAARAIVGYGFEVLEFHKISGRHLVGNRASGRVLEKIGMVREGVLRDDVLKDGKYLTVDLYGMVNPNG
jgi:ribosomal-protein-alanine N-acetyltransferase